nr:hypothetical protein [Deltaproteobacteria bacterium]
CIGLACGDDGGGEGSTAAASTGSSTAAATTGGELTSTGPGEATSTGTDPSTGADPDTGTTAADSTGAESSGTGAAAPTWNNFAMGFMETYCWECHGPGDPLRDYSELAMVMAEANGIRCGTAAVGSMLEGCQGKAPAGQFPVGNGAVPSDEERTMLVEWIDAGLPEG